jgi:hypothetical protein
MHGDYSERELWQQCLPDWAVSAFLAPFADEVGELRATFAWCVKCAVSSLIVLSLLPAHLLDAVASGALLGGAAVLLFATLAYLRFE